MNMNIKIQKYIGFYFGAIILFSQFSHARELSDLDPILNVNNIGIFIQAAECLSIRSTLKEKKAFITAHETQADYKSSEETMMDIKLMDKWEKIWKRDSDAIHIAIKKHCPYTSSLIASVFKGVSRDKRAMMLGVLEDVVTSVIASQVLDKHTRNKIFVYEYTPIGLDISPY